MFSELKIHTRAKVKEKNSKFRKLEWIENHKFKE